MELTPGSRSVSTNYPDHRFPQLGAAMSWRPVREDSMRGITCQPESDVCRSRRVDQSHAVRVRRLLISGRETNDLNAESEGAIHRRESGPRDPTIGRVSSPLRRCVPRWLSCESAVLAAAPTMSGRSFPGGRAGVAWATYLDRVRRPDDRRADDRKYRSQWSAGFKRRRLPEVHGWRSRDTCSSPVLRCTGAQNQ
jgi:hypothetical protein